jgi:tetratricopeptide (TPR) repeat protein
VNEERLLNWIGWNGQRAPVLLLSEALFSRGHGQRSRSSGDPFVDVTREWWERFAGTQNWKCAAELGKICAEKRPDLAYGWENWAWSLYKQGKTREAYNLLGPLLKGLKLAGPPSGRAAFCLACFCGELGKVKEGTRWLRLAYTLAADRDAFRVHSVLEPALREIWPGISELNENALTILE